MPLRQGRSHRNHHKWGACARPVRSGQHLEHNAQRQRASTHSAPYFAITIEGKHIPQGLVLVWYGVVMAFRFPSWQVGLRSSQYSQSPTEGARKALVAVLGYYKLPPQVKSVRYRENTLEFSEA